MNGDGEIEVFVPNSVLTINPSTLFEDIPRNMALTSSQIEIITKNLLKKLWFHRSMYFPELDSVSTRDFRNPVVALTHSGFQVNIEKNIGSHYSQGALMETAGIINKEDMTVRISEKFRPEIRNFTTSHELGHAVLHDSIKQHRDRPSDKGSHSRSRNPIEWEADKFATFFLMPTESVRTEFKKRFGTRKIVFNESTAFSMGISNSHEIEMIRNSKREFARRLAEAKFFGQMHFFSLSHQFRVSKEAMAIRLEELKLV